MSRQPVPPALTPAKIATIGALAIVLVIVLVVQFSGNGEPAVSLKRRTPKTDSPPAESIAATPATKPGTMKVRWPDIHRDEVEAFNPFEIPEALAAKYQNPAASPQASPSIQVAQAASSTPAVPAAQVPSEGDSKPDDAQARVRAQERKSRINRIRATAAALQQTGVSVVMSTSAGAVARVGDDEVRVGDVINGVLRVVEITPQGLVVEEEPHEDTGTKRP